jgi:hypothetical protein
MPCGLENMCFSFLFQWWSIFWLAYEVKFLSHRVSDEPFASRLMRLRVWTDAFTRALDSDSTEVSTWWYRWCSHQWKKVKKIHFASIIKEKGSCSVIKHPLKLYSQNAYSFLNFWEDKRASSFSFTQYRARSACQHLVKGFWHLLDTTIY